MYVISQEGHLGFWWNGDKSIFLEKETVIFPSRAECFEYLRKIHGKDKAIETIVLIKSGNGKIYSF